MERYTFAIMINSGQSGMFSKRLGEIWGDLTAYLERNNITNFSLWKVERIVFGYCESESEKLNSDAEKQVREQLISKMSDTFTWISNPNQTMKLMYHDYGIVRKNKELIRHRVFVTKLKDGCEQEYKSRHDKLIEARGNTINYGPDSNFSIWSANGYIFGYNEIDITMEREQTEEEKNGTIEWETRQLEIMDWITDDVDWMTGEWHPNITRIAWHQ